MKQAKITEASKERYNTSIQQNAPADVVKNLHNGKVWQETKSHVLGYATNEAANKAIAKQNKKK